MCVFLEIRTPLQRGASDSIVQAWEGGLSVAFLTAVAKPLKEERVALTHSLRYSPSLEGRHAEGLCHGKGVQQGFLTSLEQEAGTRKEAE